MSTAFDPGLDLTDEQREIQAVCRDFAAREIRPAAAAVDEADVEVPWDLWHQAAGLGLTSFMLPEELGGGGMTDCVTGCVVQEELSHGCAGIGNLITSNGFFAEPVLALGDRRAEGALDHAAHRRPPAAHRARGDRAGRGSDAASIKTTARRTGDGYVISGQKAWISNAGAARYYVVFATVEPGSRSRGVTAFVLEARRSRARRAARRCARWASARSPTRSCSSRTSRSAPTGGSATRARASAG